MRAFAVDHHRSRLLLLVAIAIIAVALFWPRSAAGGPIEDDPARGPSDDRGEVGDLSWSLTSTERVESSPEVLAATLSAGTTIGGALVMVFAISEQRPELGAVGALAFTLGPSTGHWYNARAWNPGLGSRLAAALVGGAGALLVLSCTDDASGGACDFGGEAALLGTAAYVAGAAYEIGTAPASARRSPRQTRLVLQPMRGHEQIVPGLALVSRF